MAIPKEHIKLVEDTIEKRRRAIAEEGREPNPEEIEMFKSAKAYLNSLRNPMRKIRPHRFDLEVSGEKVREIFPRAVYEEDAQTGELVIYTGINKEGKPVS